MTFKIFWHLTWKCRHIIYKSVRHIDYLIDTNIFFDIYLCHFYLSYNIVYIMFWLIISFAFYWFMFWLVDNYLPNIIFGFDVLSGGTWLWYILLWWIFYMIQKIIKPVVNFLAIPINIFTLGFAWTIINMWMLYMLQYIINSIWVMIISIGNVVQVFLLSILISILYKISDAVLSAIKPNS